MWYNCCSVAQLCLTFCNSMDCSIPGFPVLHLLVFAETHVHWVDDAIQPSHPLSPPSLPALNLLQHQSFPIYNEECFSPDFLEGSFRTQNCPSDRSICVIHGRFSDHTWIYANEATLGGLLVSGWRPAVLERPSMRLQGWDLKPCDKKLDLWGGKWG